MTLTADQILTQWSLRSDTWQPLELYRTTPAAEQTIGTLVAEVQRLKELTERFRKRNQIADDKLAALLNQNIGFAEIIDMAWQISDDEVQRELSAKREPNP